MNNIYKGIHDKIIKIRIIEDNKDIIIYAFGQWDMLPCTTLGLEIISYVCPKVNQSITRKGIETMHAKLLD